MCRVNQREKGPRSQRVCRASSPRDAERLDGREGDVSQDKGNECRSVDGEQDRERRDVCGLVDFS